MPASTGFRDAYSTRNRYGTSLLPPERIDRFREERTISILLKIIKGIGLAYEGLALGSFTYLLTHNQMNETKDYLYLLAIGILFLGIYLWKRDRYQAVLQTGDTEVSQFIQLQGSAPLPHLERLQVPRCSIDDHSLIIRVIQNGLPRYFREERSRLILSRKVQSFAIFFGGFNLEYCIKNSYSGSHKDKEWETALPLVFFLISCAVVLATFEKTKEETIHVDDPPSFELDIVTRS